MLERLSRLPACRTNTKTGHCSIGQKIEESVVFKVRKDCLLMAYSLFIAPNPILSLKLS